MVPHLTYMPPNADLNPRNLPWKHQWVFGEKSPKNLQKCLTTMGQSDILPRGNQKLLPKTAGSASVNPAEAMNKSLFLTRFFVLCLAAEDFFYSNRR